MLVKPAPGLQPRDPTTLQLIPHGADIDPTDLLLSRLLRDGDLVELDKDEIAALTKDQADAEAAAKAAAAAAAKQPKGA